MCEGTVSICKCSDFCCEAKRISISAQHSAQAQPPTAQQQARQGYMHAALHTDLACACACTCVDARSSRRDTRTHAHDDRCAHT